MKTLRLFILALVLAIPARAQVHLLVTTNGLIIAPPDFFGQNISDLTNALNAAGYAPGGGGGTGNASTNASQAWASGYTNTANGRWVFNGDVLAGSTNLVQKLASIELSLLGYQPASANLTNLAALNGAGITNLNATTAFSSGTVPIARLASGTPDGTKFIRDDGTLAVPSSSGVSLAGTNAWTGPNSFSADTTVSNMTVNGAMSVANISAGSIALSSPLGMANGGTGGTNAASARASLGVAYDVDVMAYRIGLLQSALALTADGHMVYHNGTLVTNLASTAAGRALLTAASASAQWNNYLLAVASTNGGYDSTSWNGITDRLVTLDQFRDAINALPGGLNAITSVTAPLSLTNGVLSIDTTGLSGGGGGISYLYAEGPSAWTDRSSSTNWYLAQYSISSNSVPSATGKYLMGDVSFIVTNVSGTTATIYMNVDVNGARVYRDSFQVSSFSGSGKLGTAKYILARESDTTATFVSVGELGFTTTTDAGVGDIGSSSANAFSFVATNVPVTWSSNVALDLLLSCDTTVTTNTRLASKRLHGSLVKLVESTGSGTSNVTGPASSTNNAIVLFGSTGGTNIIDSGVLLSDLQTHDTDLDDLADGSLSGSKIGSGINADNVTTGTLASNRLPSAISLTTLSAGTLTATSVAGDGSGLTNLNGSNIASGTVAAARIDSAIARTASPTLASPTLNDTVTYEQTVLSAHSSVTNFVADPTVSPYQTINADLTTPFATVGFLHATNVAAGRGTTILVFAGTNASVTVSLAAQFARNTNSVTLTTGQILPISFYAYGSNPTNVMATMGTVYTR